jgi:hypothetical protein
MTYEQIKDSYPFRIVRRALMKQYPWIKDVELDQDDFDNYKTVIFLNLYIDPHMLGDENDWTVASWVKPGYNAGSTIGMFFIERFPYHEVSVINMTGGEVLITLLSPGHLPPLCGRGTPSPLPYPPLLYVRMSVWGG